MANHSGHAMPQVGRNTRALKISAWLTGVYFLIELGIGIYTGSIAVISDAFHLGMTFGLVLLWASFGIMRDAVLILMEGAPAGSICARPLRGSERCPM